MGALKSTFGRLYEDIKPHMARLLASLALSAISTALSAYGPRMLGQASTLLYEGSMSALRGGFGIDFAAIKAILLRLVALYAVSSMCSYAIEFIMCVVSQSVGTSLRQKIAAKINRLPMAYFDSAAHGEILAHLTIDVSNVAANLNTAMVQTVNGAMAIVCVIIMMLSINTLLAFASVALLPVSAYLIRLIVKASQNHYSEQQKWLGKANARIEEAYSGIAAIKSFNQEERFCEEFEDCIEPLRKASRKAIFFSSLMVPLTAFASNLTFAAICAMGGWLCYQGKISVGDIQSFIIYARLLSSPVSQAAQTANMLQATAAASERIYAFLNEKAESSPKDALPVSISGSIYFSNASFSYNGIDPVLKYFQAMVQQGKKTAVVGPTGAGKSTLAKLMLRFYDLNEGSIHLDGLNIAEYERSSVREPFAIVPQEPWLFSGTIYDNIAYANPNASEDEVISAAKAAYAHNFIMQMPGGYSMAISEDATNISQGQKQLIAIARAFLADPKILILDEATSSVDTRTEALIQEATDRLMLGKTSFVIAHRLATIKNADNILVINDGRIIESGNHASLMQANGYYASVYNSQFVV
ncbi:MAG: ABC transporter ATP-binding protein/permease [Eubacteriaceae bacterium]|nr:ABC transporter ATP-binding protein/permease [Eubacteriaceae bacterium]